MIWICVNGLEVSFASSTGGDAEEPARLATARERRVAGSGGGRTGAEDARPVRPGVGRGSHGTGT
jgi:hypothetical protein